MKWIEIWSIARETQQVYHYVHLSAFDLDRCLVPLYDCTFIFCLFSFCINAKVHPYYPLFFTQTISFFFYHTPKLFQHPYLLKKTAEKSFNGWSYGIIRDILILKYEQNFLVTDKLFIAKRNLHTLMIYCENSAHIIYHIPFILCSTWPLFTNHECFLKYMSKTRAKKAWKREQKWYMCILLGKIFGKCLCKLFMFILSSSLIL